MRMTRLRISDVEQRIFDLQQRISDLEQRISDLEQRISDLQQRISDLQQMRMTRLRKMPRRPKAIRRPNLSPSMSNCMP